MVVVGAVVSLGFLLPNAVCSQRDKARRQYELAQRVYTELESRPLSKRTIPRYRKVSLAFQQVYTLDPAYQKTPAALGMTASLYEEMGRQFQDTRYCVAAIKAYQFLITQYPQSASSRDALFAMGEIYRSDLNQPDKAVDVFRKFLQRYPQGQKAAAAQQDLKEIQRSMARRAKTHRPLALAESSEAAADSSPGQAEEEQPGSTTQSLVRVTDVRSWVGPSYTRIVIGMEDQVKFTASRLRNPDRLVFDFSDTRLSPELIGRAFPVEGGFLREVRVAQFRPSVTRAVLDVERIDNYSVFSLPNPFSRHHRYPWYAWCYGADSLSGHNGNDACTPS
jgi:N-acetylmuramoyl-L-alanine amidase